MPGEFMARWDEQGGDQFAESGAPQGPGVTEEQVRAWLLDHGLSDEDINTIMKKAPGSGKTPGLANEGFDEAGGPFDPGGAPGKSPKPMFPGDRAGAGGL